MAKWSSGKYRTKDGTIYDYKSSWEAIYMDRLDSSNSILTWKYEPFFVMYLDGTKVKKYIPDFFVETLDGRKLIIEIKPERLRSGSTNSSKRLAIIQKCQEENWEYYEWSPESEILP